MSLVLGLSLISIAALIGVLLGSDDPDLQSIGRSIVIYVGALPSLLFGILLILMHWLSA